MKVFLKIAAALVLGFTFQANAFADKGHGQNSNHVANSVHVTQVKNEFKPAGQGTTIQNTKIVSKDLAKKGNGQVNFTKGAGKYDYCKSFKDYKGPCYKGKGCNFWTNCCWNQSYGCNLYWCPTEYCWFYWCQPHGCYLPVEYVPCGGYVFVE